MENAEEVFHFLEEFSKRKPKTIPQELNDYLAYVARTGDPVYQWSLVKSLFKEKLLNVITDFYETSPGIDIPPYPNVDPFNYDIMKNSLLERIDSFTSAPFTVQRICELLTYPRKQYNRIDKFMRAIEKNILVVSTREPGPQRHPEPENGEPMEPIVNGSDSNSDYNVDVEMEDMSWKENNEHRNSEPQPSSSDTHISVGDIEARLQAKQDISTDTQEQKSSTHYESVTPPELNIATDVQSPEIKHDQSISESPVEENKLETTISTPSNEEKPEIEMKAEATPALIIPEIKVDDVEMTEQRLSEESSITSEKEKANEISENISNSEVNESKQNLIESQIDIDNNSSDSNTKEEIEPKLISEVSTSSEESSSSSDNTDGNSNSPKTDIENSTDVQEETTGSNINLEKSPKPTEELNNSVSEPKEENLPQVTIQPDDYSISDVNSELCQLQTESNDDKPNKDEEKKPSSPNIENKTEDKTENIETNVEDITT